ncbi:MAG: DUF5686 family protein [Rhodothermales bacterium]
MKVLRLFFLMIGLIIVLPVQAQKLIRGTIIDASTGEALPAANIQVEGTYRGTISSVDGAYEIQLTRLPATLVVRYIGYNTERLTVTASSEERQDVRLRPVTYELDEVVVTGEDPAVRIMREVIERKKVWRASLQTYATDAYNRFTISNDTGIVSIIETMTETFWDHERGMRETLKARRETSNLDIEEALPAALFVTNLYDDDIEVGGYSLIGVTHPKALSQYTFHLEGTRYLDDRIVYDISVEPKNKLKSAFVGRVSVLDEVYALIDVELRPGEAFLFPPPIEQYDVTYRQQFSNFGRDVWLPVDFRADIDVKISFGALLSFPTFRIDQVSRFTDYGVNVALPDTLYENGEYLNVDSVAVAEGTSLSQDGVAVPLSEPEQVAYAGIDSTMGLEKAFAPTGALGRLARIQMSEDEDGSDTRRRRLPANLDLEPDLWYNRVDALHAGLGLEVRAGSSLRLDGGAGYSTGLSGREQWSYQGSARLSFGPDETVFIEAGYAAGTALRYDTDLYGRLTAGLATLLGGDDYFDYYRREGLSVTAGYHLSRLDATLSVGYRDEDHTSLARTTSYDFLGRSAPLRANPPIEEGRLRAVTASVAIGDDEDFAGLFGRRLLVLTVEHSSPDGLNSDYDYTRYAAVAEYRLETFFRRRLLPNTLDARLVAGTFSGRLPVQRFGIVDAGLGRYTPFGSLRTLGGLPYEGEQYVAFFWEHNFRTVPFEWLGLRWLAERSYNIILFGGHGRTWLSNDIVPELGYVPNVSDGFHHEMGLSLSGLFSFFRIDFAKRLDAPGFNVGVAAARIF